MVFSGSVNRMGSIHSFNKVTKIIIREISSSLGMMTGNTSREQKYSNYRRALFGSNDILKWKM
jgi:hypothetical protein